MEGTCSTIAPQPLQGECDMTDLGPRAQQRPGGPGRGRGLPVEIWYHILHMVFPDPPATWVHASTARGRSGSLLGQYDRLKDFKAAQRALLNLFLCSRGLAALVEPFLYHSVLLTSGRGLGCLAELLRQRPHIAKYTKRFYCLIDMTSDAVIEDWYFYTQEQKFGKDGIAGPLRTRSSQNLPAPPLLSAPPKKKGKKSRPAKPARPVATHSWDSRRQRPCSVLPVFADILAQLSLTDLLCPWDYLAEARKLLESVGPADPAEATDADAAADADADADAEAEAEADVIAGPNADDLVRSIDTLNIREGKACFAPILLQLDWFPNLSTLNATHVHGHGMIKEIPSQPHPVMPSLRHLRLYEVMTTEAELARLCRACPVLETLVVRFHDYGSTSGAPRVQSSPLSDALLERAATLRHLDIHSANSGRHFLGQTAESSSNDPRQLRLACLPALHRLEYLSTDFAAIFGQLGALEPQDLAALETLLPASLAELHVSCVWPARESRDLPEPEEAEDGAKLIAKLQQLHTAGGSLPPALRRACISMPWFKFDSPGKGVVECAKEYFAATEVEFEVKWEHRWSHRIYWLWR